MSPYNKRRLIPTYKWWAATVTAAASVATVMWTGDGLNTDDEKILVIGLVTQRLIAWLVPKDRAA